MCKCVGRGGCAALVWRAGRRALGGWRRWCYERRLLATMTEAEMKDVGISLADAHEELRRPFWSRRPRG
jgi:uncharacterized protein YjiS (DUF1127 family)